MSVSFPSFQPQRNIDSDVFSPFILCSFPKYGVNPSVQEWNFNNTVHNRVLVISYYTSHSVPCDSAALVLIVAEPSARLLVAVVF
jgi:hypothetical protein